jgi:hypothetical protein
LAEVDGDLFRIIGLRKFYYARVNARFTFSA